MKKGLLIVGMIVVLIGGFLIGSYNGLASSRENIASAQADIDTMLQRRADLIPNLVSTVKSFAAHETEVYDAVLEARTQLMNASTMQDKADADAALDAALTQLNVVVEAYPELKSDTTYIGLMDELAGSEKIIMKWCVLTTRESSHSQLAFWRICLALQRLIILRQRQVQRPHQT